MRPNAWIELDAEVLRENLQGIRATLRPGTELILVVKANAYGHGLRMVSACAWSAGVRWFLVARLDEALELREAVQEARILLLGAVGPEDVGTLLELGITPVVVDVAQGLALGQAATRRGATLACHVKVDTGMGRLGLPWEGAATLIKELHAAGGLVLEGVCTHLASAGRPNDPFAELQVSRFRSVVAQCRAAGIHLPFQHLANSAAFATRPDWDMQGVRVGLLAYGYSGRRVPARMQTRPFLQWKSRVIQVKAVPAGFPVSYLSTHVTPVPTQLATVDVGYSDGFSRLMSNKGYVLVGGRRARVVGRVTMNFTTVDVGPDAVVRVGDEVVLIGEQGGEALWADELARWCQTIPYEILTSIRSRDCTVSGSIENE